jgi:lipopolysaccharide biosynthesis glycosyltransferase
MTINLAISTDEQGFVYNATLIASILRRTEQAVHVRCWCRGFLPESFETGQLRVEFLPAVEEVTGRYPGSSGPAAYDRLLVIRDCPDWDRCMVMDYDQLVLCDLKPLFELDLGDHLLAAHMQGPGVDMAYAMRVWLKRPIPEGWEHVASHPYFLMPPMLNLRAMRESGTWDTFLKAHGAFGADEQLSLTAATEGRSLPIEAKWNLFPRHHIKDGEVPEGVIHWSGWPKPWHRGAKVWRPDIWLSEEVSWEHLRMGIWKKPVAVEVEPPNGFGVRALASRGWKVTVFGKRFEQSCESIPKLDDQDSPFPDVTLHSEDHECFKSELIDSPEVVRFSRVSKASEWLAEVCRLPTYLALQGPVARGEIRSLRLLGYGAEVRYSLAAWPTGGPMPRVLSFKSGLRVSPVGSSEEIYLKWTGESFDLDNCDCDSHSDSECIEEPWPWQMPDSVRQWLSDSSLNPSNILELGFGHSTVVLFDLFPESTITALEHYGPWFEDCLERVPRVPRLEPIHAPLVEASSWYDWRDVEIGEIDLLVVDCPPGARGKMVRDGATNVRRYLAPQARVILLGMEDEEERKALSRWLDSGGMIVERDEEEYVVLQVVAPFVFQSAYPQELSSLADLTEKIYLISLPERQDRREMIRKNWAPLGLEFEIIDGVRPLHSEIRWDEMKGMEAYGKADHLRGSYVLGAVGCKRAGIRALEKFLDSGAHTALICQDDCLWREDAADTVRKAMRELPSDWDMVYFSASSRIKNRSYSPWLTRLGGARFCTAILWKREAAERWLPELKACDCEWDLFMQRIHSMTNAYCVSPMPAFQARSKSDIVGGIVQPPNL